MPSAQLIPPTGAAAIHAAARCEGRRIVEFMPGYDGVYLFEVVTFRGAFGYGWYCADCESMRDRTTGAPASHAPSYSAPWSAAAGLRAHRAAWECGDA